VKAGTAPVDAGNGWRRRGVEQHVATIRASRFAAFRALWKAVSQGRRPGAPSLDERLRTLPRMISGALTGRYPELSRAKLALLVLALAYLVSPIDLVPEALLPIVGLLDDGVVALWLGGAFLAETDRFVAWQSDRRSPEPTR
jgi:uncharacterized membrane protein YkvA (DUF1232 family)